MLMKTTFGALICAMIFCTGAFAQTCPAYPSSFTSGANAVASEVNSPFASILNCANNNLAPINSPNFNKIGIGVSPTDDLDIVDNWAGVSQATIHNTSTAPATVQARYLLDNG